MKDIILDDSTQINVEKYFGSMYTNNINEQWKLIAPGRSPLLVKLNGEENYRKYNSITFKPNWGTFIEGDLFEE